MAAKHEKFPHESVSEALERAIRNAKHLRAKDAALIAAARSLAWKIDNWDRLAKIALEDALEDGSRPAVPANDNTSLPTFLKYCSSLGLTPAMGAATAMRPEETPPAKKKPRKKTDFETYMERFG